MPDKLKELQETLHAGRSKWRASISQATAQEARQHCRDNLGRHEVPRKVHLVPQLPKNLGGKVLKRELRKSGEYERGMDSRGT